MFQGLRILHTPGHTPGTQSVAVDTEKGIAVIAGMCSIYQTFQTPKEVLPEEHPYASWEVFVPSVGTDMNQSYDSMLRLKRMADVLLPCHGPGFTESTKEFVNR